ncbi:hypothetical protein BDW59DRAFT_172424 [Aspergillus cavernicola]|uniref:Zn(2)-C6 fungal-type domain-containing protein n=1 Tax=Aspergillus cavernicola TaxID=176166 RepID=A0ABR4IC79_9EURO
MLTPEAQSNFRPRRRHRKSRNGCLECKRRRIKCDEIKPSCSRCILTLQDCIYAPASQAQCSGNCNDDSSNELRLPSPASPSPRSGLSPSPGFFFDVPTLLPPPPVEELALSDADLYHHYLQHTSRTLSHNQTDQRALQIGMPTLALRSKTVFHSVLAVSAACMCCDMISQQPPPDVSAVTQVLMTGYRHYNLASERIRDLISKPDALRAEPLLAASPLLVPFAASSQQINHWISSRTGVHQSHKPLSSTPRDIIVIMRGIKTTLQALGNGSMSPIPSPIPTLETHEDSDSIDDCPLTMLDPNIPPSPTPPSRTHPMFPLIAETSQIAFSKLQERLKSTFLYQTDPIPNHSLSACAAAFELLSTIRTNSFSQSPSPTPLPFPNQTQPSIPHVSPWLLSFSTRPALPSPTEPLTRSFLAFLVQAPQAYLDLVLPLLDQRMESPTHARFNNINNPASIDLTPEQALALDIYAHWSVLMLLVEEESWWIGKLPSITLTGMLNGYGDGFVGRLWPGFGNGNGEGQGQWWPKSMLGVWREVGRFR